MYFGKRPAEDIRFWLVAALAVVVLAGVSLCGQKGEPVDGPLEVSVMSFNIRYGTADDGENRWQNRRQMVFGLVGKYDPDVVGLLVALGFQIEEICKALPRYAMIGGGRDDGKTKGEYSAILYRRERFEVEQGGTFWLSDTPEVPGSITWGNACTRICTWARFIERKTGKTFYHYNLHLDHISQPSREKSVVLLAERIRNRKNSDPLVVTGDFNAGENNQAILFLKGKTTVPGKDNANVENPIPMVDTFRVLHPDANDVGTFNGFKGDCTGDKIDFVLTTSDVQALDAQIIRDNVDGRYPSDHFPVTARIRLPATSGR